VGRSVTEELGAATAAGTILFSGGLLYLLFLVFRGNIRTRLTTLTWQYFLICGSLFILYMICLYLAIGWAFTREQFLEIGLINYLWPALTVLFAVPILKRKAHPVLPLGLLVALFGIFLVVTHTGEFSWATFTSNLTSNPVVYALALGAALAWALYSNLSRRLAPDADSGALAFFMLAAGLILFFIRWVLAEESTWNTTALIEIGYMACASTLGYVFWDIAMRKGNLVLVASCSYLIPFLSVLVACTYLNITPGLKLWPGCGLIILGAVISKRAVKD